jgi:hypothetical protein
VRESGFEGGNNEDLPTDITLLLGLSTFQSRSAPNTDFDIGDPVSLSELADVEARNMPDTNVEIGDPVSLSELADVE